ncbi:MAG: FimB/Mfa2 family fimbrial subunit [Bacteroidales bacterium]|nr:FimB/Mfa2 family fimbrial subunit [Bacteroidales bacterium]
MIRNILKYSILFGLIFGAVSCDKLIYDDVDEKPDAEAKVYLAVTRAAHVDGNESINKDEIDFEDRVHDMAMFVFDNASGDLVGEPYFESAIPLSDKSKTFVVKLTPGQRDFYFVANMPMTADLTGITTRTALETYMKKTVDLNEDLYLNAKDDKGFPMPRIYHNQTITTAGTIYTPAPFKPDGEDRVKLQRVVAQLQVDIDGTEIGAVKNVYFKNAFRKFSLLADGVMTSPEYYVETATNNALRKSANSYIYYMPEALMSTPVWTATDHKPINYFVIETVTGTTYEIPIITYKDPIPGGNYLSFARGEQTDKPDYNIYRNNRYLFTIKSLEDIQIDYVVNPWTLVQSSFYMGYGYNVGVDEDGNVTISNTVEACTPHDVKLVTKSGFEFDGGETEKTFVDTDPTASVSYKVSPVPTAGQAYLEVYYNDELVKTFTK